MSYKFQRIISSYLNLKNNEILEKKLWRISNLSSKVEDFKVFVRLFRLPILMIAL